MKKLFAVMSLLACLISTNAVNAQYDTAAQAPAPAPASDEPDFRKGEFGVRFMPTFSSFTIRTKSSSEVTAELTFGYGLGFMLAGNFTEHVGIQTEVIYNSLAQKFKDNELDRKISIKYLNIPLFLSLNTGKGKPVNFNFVGGPQIGINLGSEIETSGDRDTDTLQAVLALKKSDLGLAYGAGVEFLLNPAKTARIDVGFRGVYGIIDISDKSTSTTTDQYYILDRAKVKTYSGYLGFTYLF